ncbi:MAG: translesion error-prone DNA polymerase V autoproteolytic subunit [Bacteroidota bacterium]|nr:translesion error-prone DNA polymerase V autoproteolytic subunit [Bacteroidota bacterium]
MPEEISITKIINPVACGFPSPAMDYMEERISLDKEFIKHPLSTILATAEGTSMINAFIPDGGKLLIDKSITAKSGDIVVAILNGEFTVKFLKINQFKCWLCPANPKYQDIEITEEMNMQIYGVVTTIFIDANDVRRCML